MKVSVTDKEIDGTGNKQGGERTLGFLSILQIIEKKEQCPEPRITHTGC